MALEAQQKDVFENHETNTKSLSNLLNVVTNVRSLKGSAPPDAALV